MSMVEKMVVLIALCLFNQSASGKTLEVYVDNSGAVYAFEKGYSRRCRYLNTDIRVIMTLSHALGVKVKVTDVPRRSDWGLEVADDLSKGIVMTFDEFMGSYNKRLVAPESVCEWVRKPTKDNIGLGYRIMHKLMTVGADKIVPPFRPKFDNEAMDH